MTVPAWPPVPAVLRGDTRDAFLEFDRSHRERRHSPRTMETYGESAAQFQRWLDARGGADVIDAGREDISDFLIWAGQPPRSSGTAANRYRGLRQFFRFCAAEDILPADPMDKVRACTPRYKMPEVLADEALAALLASCAGKDFEQLRDAAIIRIWCEPGSPRASEMAALDVADVDLERELLVIRDGKGGLRRSIALSPGTARALFRYRRARARHPRAALTGAMWLGPKGALTRSGLGQMLARRAAAAGLPHIHPHQLRHTAFSDFDEASGNINHAMALFGWKSPAMAHYYGRDARDRKALAAARALGRADRLTRR